MNRRAAGWALVSVAALGIAYAAFVVLTSYAGEYWGVALLVAVIAGSVGWRLLRTRPP